LIYLQIPKSILGMRKNHFSQSLNVFGINDDRQTEVQAGVSLMPDSIFIRSSYGY
jgi:hypothetical protein